MKPIRQVAVLGAGTMGARIAAHCANAGIPALLFDLTTALAAKGLETARKQSPAGFYTEQGVALVTPGSFDEHLCRLSGADWVIEAVTENLEVKRTLWSRALQHAPLEAVLSTNTSGIPLRSICEGWPEQRARRFLGTHFFNPPRYLHLLELIPAPHTDASLLRDVAAFADRTLGKGVVVCKDTPNFIANRIGSFYGATIYQLMQRLNLSIEEVDALTGPIIGLPKSASFRLLDIVGLDVWNLVSKNLYDLVPDDPWRERFLPPPFLTEMLSRGWLGDKTGQGFYQRRGPKKEIWAIDWKTFEYHPAAKPKLPALENAKLIEDLPSRLRALFDDKSKAGEFYRGLFGDVYSYASAMLPEIAHSADDIDHAMQWGYAHTVGPFGVARILNLQPPPPAEVESSRSGVVILRRQPVVQSNPGASLRDLGDGCLCLEFHSKMNSLGDDGISMIHSGLKKLESDFDAMVIANQGENFSVGANLMLVLLAAQEQEWDDLNAAIHRFQQASMAIKYAAKPVVVAPHQRALGGGCELVLHAPRVQSAAELYMGLVEVGVGVIPGAGGCKELIARLKDPRKVFELIGMAKVSTSAENAKELGLLDKSAAITMNPERLIGDAKQTALSMASAYRPGAPRNDIKVGGDPAFAALRIGAWQMRQAEYISDHDMLIAEKLARVLTGGVHPGDRLVSEQFLLDLEREAFLSLCGTVKTQERIAYMLKNGKPLRN
ncbi:3-hydroxyacyl-CoA dehydrogenase/enoyl-CoA hydratase family protein [uncultured Paludibaculum sp.]|uniref:3-hydroxyacyl-CoA dehydrogenase/enoyl-CoA hydratase family protein n=1 Tax=uncultured Paludibaculum sp. TaxID=1765020 RepID=UPI002AAA90CE|nr:3-hydroxyacyl-CoA dehydrogenase/enoyl-CoA hydratase family protein [uncultured Paludibaculum sp.]